MSSSTSFDAVNAIVLGGGAIRGFALLGALQYLSDHMGHAMFTSIDKYIGTSVGAIISYLLCIGYTPMELMILLCQHDFLSRLSYMNMLNVLDGQGAVSFSIIQDVLEKLTIDKLGHFVTLQQLYELTGKILICTTYNLTHDRVEYMSAKIHPDLPCLVALRMSASLPFVFEPCRYHSCIFLDGGLLDNFPIDALEPTDHALGIRLLSDPSTDGTSSSILSHVMEMVMIPVRHLERLRLSMSSDPPPYHLHTVTIRFQGSDFLRFHLSTAEKFDLFSLGYTTMRDWMVETLSSVDVVNNNMVEKSKVNGENENILNT